MRTRHPFPDVDLTTHGTESVDVVWDEMVHIPPERFMDGPRVLVQHTHDNRRTRLGAVATFVPPEGEISRREMWAQRQRVRRGKLDPELRRLQRKALR